VHIIYLAFEFIRSRTERITRTIKRDETPYCGFLSHGNAGAGTSDTQCHNPEVVNGSLLLCQPKILYVRRFPVFKITQ
jgi:hypothetical protein